MKRVIILVILMMLSCNLYSQMVRQWKTVGTGGFTGNDLKYNFSFVKGGKYIAVIPSSTSNADYDSLGTVNGCLLSSDSGRSFAKTFRYETGFSKTDTNITSTNFHSVEMPSENLILAIGENKFKSRSQDTVFPFINRSTDFGKSWEKIWITKDTVGYFRTCISMLNDTFGIMISGRKLTPEDTNPSALYKTYDGGKTWIENKIFLIKYYYAGQIKCYSEDNYVVRANGKVYLTQDGGLNWITTNPPPVGGGYSFCNEILWFVSGVSNNMCFLFKTTDKGATWIKVNDNILVPGTPMGFEVDFFDEDNGLGISAVYGEIMRTTDGGKTWNFEVTPHECYGENFQSAHFISRERAIALSISRIYLYTGNMVLMPPSTTIIKDTNKLLDYKISWFKIKGGEKYKIQLSESKTTGLPTYTIPDYEQHLIVNEDNITDSIYNLTGILKFNKRYHVRVKTYTDITESDWSKMKYFDTPADTAHYPTLDTCKIIEPNLNKFWPTDSITFIWNKVNNAQKYTLNVCTPFTYNTGFYEYSIENLTDTSFTLKKFYHDAQYLSWVVAEADGWANSPQYIQVFLTDKYADVKENYDNYESDITPNPASNYIDINLENVILSDAKNPITIYNTFGECVFTIPVSTGRDTSAIGGHIRIDVSGLVPGLYYVRVGEKVHKFVKI